MVTITQTEGVNVFTIWGSKIGGMDRELNPQP